MLKPVMLGKGEFSKNRKAPMLKEQMVCSAESSSIVIMLCEASSASRINLLWSNVTIAPLLSGSPRKVRLESFVFIRSILLPPTNSAATAFLSDRASLTTTRVSTSMSCSVRPPLPMDRLTPAPFLLAAPRFDAGKTASSCATSPIWLCRRLRRRSFSSCCSFARAEAPAKCAQISLEHQQTLSGRTWPTRLGTGLSRLRRA